MTTCSLRNAGPSFPSKQLAADWSWTPAVAPGCLGCCPARSLPCPRFSLLWFLIWIRPIDIRWVSFDCIHLFSWLGSCRWNLPRLMNSFEKTTGFQSLRHPSFRACPCGWPVLLPAHSHQAGSDLQFSMYSAASTLPSWSFSSILKPLWKSWNTSPGMGALLLLSLGWYQAHQIHQLLANPVYVSISP